jgi:hypothetical protein
LEGNIVAEQRERAKQTEPDLALTRSEEFENLFANNVRFESTLWDLRLMFGQVDLAAKQIVQHTAINIPWPQVKIASYLMLVNLVVQQALNGNVFLPPFVMPPRPNASDPAFAEFDKRLVEYLAWIHDQMFGSDPYIPPAVAAIDEQKPVV